MSKIKPTEPPVMKKDQHYLDWKKELQIWQVTNLTLGVDPKVQGGILLQSLEGKPHDTILSELTVPDITSPDGVKNITKTLDKFFLGNETQNAYSAIDELLHYKCSPTETMENFLVQFQLKVNKVKASGTILSEGVLGYTLLSSANLSEDSHNMVKATCDELTFKNVKAQLTKIGFSKTRSQGKFLSEPSTSKVKIESYYESSGRYYQKEASESSSDEDLNGERVFYSDNKFNDSKKIKMNPTDRFGHVRACSFCKCLYHWLIDCPYAPNTIKSNLTRSTNKSGKNL